MLSPTPPPQLHLSVARALVALLVVASNALSVLFSVPPTVPVASAALVVRDAGSAAPLTAEPLYTVDFLKAEYDFANFTGSIWDVSFASDSSCAIAPPPAWLADANQGNGRGDCIALVRFQAFKAAKCVWFSDLADVIARSWCSAAIFETRNAGVAKWQLGSFYSDQFGYMRFVPDVIKLSMILQPDADLLSSLVANASLANQTIIGELSSNKGQWNTVYFHAAWIAYKWIIFIAYVIAQLFALVFIGQRMHKAKRLVWNLPIAMYLSIFIFGFSQMFERIELTPYERQTIFWIAIFCGYVAYTHLLLSWQKAVDACGRFPKYTGLVTKIVVGINIVVMFGFCLTRMLVQGWIPLDSKADAVSRIFVVMLPFTVSSQSVLFIVYGTMLLRVLGNAGMTEGKKVLIRKVTITMLVAVAGFIGFFVMTSVLFFSTNFTPGVYVFTQLAQNFSGLLLVVVMFYALNTRSSSSSSIGRPASNSNSYRGSNLSLPKGQRQSSSVHTEKSTTPLADARSEIEPPPLPLGEIFNSKNPSLRTGTGTTQMTQVENASEQLTVIEMYHPDNRSKNSKEVETA